MPPSLPAAGRQVQPEWLVRAAAADGSGGGGIQTNCMWRPWAWTHRPSSRGYTSGVCTALQAKRRRQGTVTAGTGANSSLEARYSTNGSPDRRHHEIENKVGQRPKRFTALLTPPRIVHVISRHFYKAAITCLSHLQAQPRKAHLQPTALAPREHLAGRIRTSRLCCTAGSSHEPGVCRQEAQIGGWRRHRRRTGRRCWRRLVGWHRLLARAPGSYQCQLPAVSGRHHDAGAAVESQGEALWAR